MLSVEVQTVQLKHDFSSRSERVFLFIGYLTGGAPELDVAPQLTFMWPAKA